MSAITDWFTPARRKAMYLILVALVPVVSIYGWASDEQVAAWLGVAGAVLGLGTAAANTHPEPRPAPEPPVDGWP